MAYDINRIKNDPGFAALPRDVQEEVMTKVDPNFSKMDFDVKEEVIAQLTAGHPDPIAQEAAQKFPDRQVDLPPVVSVPPPSQQPVLTGGVQFDGKTYQDPYEAKLQAPKYGPLQNIGHAIQGGLAGIGKGIVPLDRVDNPLTPEADNIYDGQYQYNPVGQMAENATRLPTTLATNVIGQIFGGKGFADAYAGINAFGQNRDAQDAALKAGNWETQRQLAATAATTPLAAMGLTHLTQALPGHIGKSALAKISTGGVAGYGQDIAMSALDQLAQTGKIDPSTLNYVPNLGTLLGAGLPGAGAALKKAKASPRVGRTVAWARERYKQRYGQPHPGIEPPANDQQALDSIYPQAPPPIDMTAPVVPPARPPLEASVQFTEPAPQEVTPDVQRTGPVGPISVPVDMPVSNDRNGPERLDVLAGTKTAAPASASPPEKPPAKPEPVQSTIKAETKGAKKEREIDLLREKINYYTAHSELKAQDVLRDFSISVKKVENPKDPNGRWYRAFFPGKGTVLFKEGATFDSLKLNGNGSLVNHLATAAHSQGALSRNVEEAIREIHANRFGETENTGADDNGLLMDQLQRDGEHAVKELHSFEESQALHEMNQLHAKIESSIEAVKNAKTADEAKAAYLEPYDHPLIDVADPELHQRLEDAYEERKQKGYVQHQGKPEDDRGRASGENQAQPVLQIKSSENETEPKAPKKATRHGSVTLQKVKHLTEGQKETLAKATYETTTDKQRAAKAKQSLKDDPNQFYANLKDEKYLNANPDQAVFDAHLAAARLTKEGRFDDATDILANTSERLSKAGQTIQAASVWNKTTPEGFMLFAQKVAKKGRLNQKAELATEDLQKQAEKKQAEVEKILAETRPDEEPVTLDQAVDRFKRQPKPTPEDYTYLAKNAYRMSQTMSESAFEKALSRLTQKELDEIGARYGC